MMIIKIFITLFGFNFMSTVDSLTVSSKVTEATVFEKGALVTRTIDLSNLNQTTEVLIEKLDLQIDRKSIEVLASEGLEILSVKNETYTDSTENYKAVAKSYQDQINQLNDSIKLYQRFAHVLNQERDLFEDNDDFESETEGVDVDKLEHASRLYKKRLREIEIELFEIELKIKDFQTEIQKLYSSFSKLSNQNIKEWLRVRILTRPIGGRQGLSLKYYHPSAGWTPYYDARVSDLSEDLRLDLKANVFQTTGEKWDRVKLTLTNSNPSKNQTPPSIIPFFLNAGTDMISYNPSSENGVISGFVTDTNGEALIGANVFVEGTGNGTITDIDGSFELFYPGNKKLIISYTGYNTKRIYFNNRNPIIKLEEGALLDEVVVVGSRSTKTDYYIDGVRAGSQFKKVKQERKVVTVQKSESFTSVNYVLEEPYSFLSSKDPSEVFIDKKSIAANYYYQILPRHSKQAYLMASVPQWEDYDLLEAPVNIYHNNSYKGNTHIDPELMKDTLELSIGIDPEVVVSREQLKDYTKKSFLKNKITEEMAWQIIVKNAKRKSITIKIKDQYPVSNDKGIKVDLIESGEASIDKKRGLLDWNIKLEKGETFKNNLIYKVKYPSDQKLVLI